MVARRYITVEVRDNRLPQIRAALPRAVQAIVAKATFDAQASALVHVPVDTGHLKNSLAVDIDKSLTGAVGTLYTDVSYAPFQEFGTRFQPGRAYMRPAFDATAPGFRAAMGAIAPSVV